MKDAIAFEKQLFDEGAVNKYFLTDKNGQVGRQNFLQGKLGIFHLSFGSLDQELYKDFKKSNPNGEYIVMAIPKSSYGQFAPSTSLPLSVNAEVNKSAKDPETVMKYVDFLADPQNTARLTYGYKGVNYNIGENGCPQAVAGDVNKNTLTYDGDLNMLSSNYLYGECAYYKNSLDSKDPVQNAIMKLNDQATDLYLSGKYESIPLYWNQLTPLPADLTQIADSVRTQMVNNWQKAIVSTGYSADQAMKDNQKIWDNAGGKKIETFYADWYDKNKDNIVTTKDYLEFVHPPKTSDFDLKEWAKNDTATPPAQ
jgi:putative aldouronate transport system substrate-binding protein